MRRVRLSVGSGPLLTALVAETPAEQSWGLQGLPWLRDDEGMLFSPSPWSRSVQPMSISMKSVSFPIDVLFFDSGARVEQIIHDVQPGDPRIWTYLATGALEVRGGWARDYLIRLGDPLSVSS